MTERILDSVTDAALRAYYGTPEREFTTAGRTRMARALAAARGSDGGRTITIDLDTGAWMSESTLQPGDGYRVAAAVLPGMPEPEIEKAYGAWMTTDPAPEETRPEECGSTLGIRYPSAPSDEWETATCIQEHDGSPGADGTIHDSGDGWKWMLLDGFQEVAPLIVPSTDLKALRETLCRIQAAPIDADDSARLGALIQAIDDHRPLGADGKHGDLHTPTCGCDDR